MEYVGREEHAEFAKRIDDEQYRQNKRIVVMCLIQIKRCKREQKMETIISSCITAAVTLIICLLNNHGQQEKTRALMEYKLDELTKRVDKHNHVVERTYSIERELSIQKEQIKVANHRIEDLEGIEHEH